MKKIVCVLLVLTLCLGMTGCGIIDLLQKEKAKEDESEPKETEKVVESSVPPPYIGYAQLSESEVSVVDLMRQTVPNQANIDILKYDGGDANMATIKVERSDKKGNWVTEEKGMLFLTKNVHKGYMAFVGDANNGITASTSPVDVVKEATRVNTVSLNGIKPKGDEGEFAESVNFGELMVKDKSNPESRIDLTTKQVLQMNFKEHPVYERFGKVVSPESEDVTMSNITEIYINEGEKFKKAYEEQEMVAVTIEFENDANLQRSPYVCEPRVDESEEKETEGELVYNSGEYTRMKISLEEKGEEGWRTLGKPVEIDLKDMNGRIRITDDLKENKKLMVEVAGNKELTFNLPKEEEKDSKILGYSSLIPGKDEGYLNTKEKTPIIIAEEAVSENGVTLKDFEDDALKDIYGNSGGEYSELYSAQYIYAVMVQMLP